MRNKIIESDLEEVIKEELPWEMLAGKTILITGASGLLASYMVDTLLYLNETHLVKNPVAILAMVRNQERAKKRYPYAHNRSDLIWLVQDVSHKMPCKYTPDYIVHSASYASPKFYSIDPVGVLAANILGTQNLLSLAKTSPVQGFLLFSSGEVYGNFDAPLTIDEKTFGSLDPLDKRACYAESKRMAETLCSCYCRQFGVPITIARISHTFGPGMRQDDGRVFADFIFDALHGRDITLKSDGLATRPFCYLTDATRAFFRILLLGQPGQAYNVANPKNMVTIRAFASAVAKQAKPSPVDVVFAKPNSRDSGFPKNQLVVPLQVSIQKLEELGWTPRISLEESITRTMNSYERVATT